MMASAMATVGPKTIEKADRLFLEANGSALVWNTYLKIALLLVSLVALGVLALAFHAQVQLANVKPMVIRIDSLGRSEAFSYDDATTYTPQVNEVRYFLKQFVVMHFSRVRATLARDFPQSLLFLEPSLQQATLSTMTQNQLIQKYLEAMMTEEVEIDFKNITVTELRTPPFRAQIDFAKQTISPISRAVRGTQLFTAQVEFLRMEHPPDDWVLTNPLGFQIIYIRVDPALK